MHVTVSARQALESPGAKLSDETFRVSPLSSSRDDMSQDHQVLTPRCELGKSKHQFFAFKQWSSAPHSAMSDFRDILGMDKSAEKKQKKKATPAASKEPEEAKRAVVGTLGKRSESGVLEKL